MSTLPLGFFLDEDAHGLLCRAAALAEMLATTFGECDGRPGAPPLMLDAATVSVLGEYLRDDLRRALAQCRFTPDMGRVAE